MSLLFQIVYVYRYANVTSYINVMQKAYLTMQEFNVNIVTS